MNTEELFKMDVLQLTNSYDCVLIDAEDKPRIDTLKTKWSLLRQKNGDISGIKSTRTFKGNKTIWLHRFLMGSKNGDRLDIDHEDMSPLDNRKCNLRICNRSENQCNRGKNKNNTTGEKCIFWEERPKKFRVRIKKYNKLYHCGLFDTIEKAIKVRDEKLKELHGEFARLN